MTACVLAAAENIETMKQGWGGLIFGGFFLLSAIGVLIWWLTR